MIRRLHSQLMRVAGALRTEAIKSWSFGPLIRSVEKSARILEIGGGYNPRFVKAEYANAYHLDHCTTEELREKYARDPSVVHLAHRIQHVDFTANCVPIDSVIPAHIKFDVVYSSHALEHQVDLIGHFQSIDALLMRGARYISVIPDYRHCFDALRFPTVTGDVISAHLGQHRLHRRKQVFDGLSRAVTVNPGRRVRRSDLADARFSHTLESAWKATLGCEREDAPYLDVHAWVFSPASFELLLLELYILGLTSLSVTYMSPTYGNQFCAVLSPGVPAAEISEDVKARLEKRRWVLCKRLRR